MRSKAVTRALGYPPQIAQAVMKTHGCMRRLDERWTSSRSCSMSTTWTLSWTSPPLPKSSRFFGPLKRAPFPIVSWKRWVTSLSADSTIGFESCAGGPGTGASEDFASINEPHGARIAVLIDDARAPRLKWVTAYESGLKRRLAVSRCIGGPFEGAGWVVAFSERVRSGIPTIQSLRPAICHLAHSVMNQTIAYDR